MGARTVPEHRPCLFGRDLHVHFGVQSARRTGTWAGQSGSAADSKTGSQRSVEMISKTKTYLSTNDQLNFGIFDHRIRPSEEVVAYGAPFCSSGHGALMMRAA